MPSRKLIALILTVSLVSLAACAAPSTSPRPTAGPQLATGPASARFYDHLPLYFVQNRGQTDPRVAYYVPGKNNTIYFAPEGLTFAFTTGGDPRQAMPVLGPRADGPALPRLGVMQSAPQPAQRWAVKLDFVGANPNVRPLGESQTGAIFSYFKGQPGQWQAGVPGFAQLRYPGLWPGIDLVYSGQANQLKYEFVVQPGADPARIQLAYRGASLVRLTADGQLEVTTPLTSFRDAAPLAYQVKDGRRVPVEMRYALDPPVGAGPAAAYAYSFSLGVYDHALPLILDPTLVVYAGYIGGAGYDEGDAIAVDQNGNAYITGKTASDETTFPVTIGPDLTANGGNYDAFVAKVNAAGTALVYAGYIGGANNEAGYGIAVDKDGNAYVTGDTNSDQTTFPVKIGPDLTYNGGTYDAFVAKVNAAGTGLDYAGYIGGAGNDFGFGVAVDQNGNAYVTGQTGSTESSFPVKTGPDLTYNGAGGDAFVAQVNAAGAGLVYAGYIGGSSLDVGYGIAVDGAGNAYVVGTTYSDQATLPVTVGPDLTYNGLYDAFVAKVNAGGATLAYAGYIGGAGNDDGYGVAVDKDGNAYVTGDTGSDQSTFPVLGGPVLTYSGAGDAFVAKVNAGGATLGYAGYIGGSDLDIGSGIAVDKDGNAYVTGHTASDQATFPVTGGPDVTYNGGVFDAFVAKVVVSGTALAYAGYIGGAGVDEGTGIAVDNAGNAYITGWTNSDQTTFPVTGGPDLTYNGGVDAFVVRIMSFVPSRFIYLPLTRR